MVAIFASRVETVVFRVESWGFRVQRKWWAKLEGRIRPSNHKAVRNIPLSRVFWPMVAPSLRAFHAFEARSLNCPAARLQNLKLEP